LDGVDDALGLDVLDLVDRAREELVEIHPLLFLVS
jgi:hypothetical protein